ncbi:restriction endonuclease subunit S [Extensimonas sp. H3M7-6]|uniref:restriction endonuclease subunit S n=1 Tax=Extensimonas soli TaxID=3031322 RepID=UPI0023DCAD45|nr:restriction endonuclease subunit S [Extensimonas sp. H3M7-6]
MSEENTQKSALVPRLRFPEFREAGEWEEKSIGDSCESFSGGTPSTINKDFYGGDIPFIRSAEIDKNKTELFLTIEGLNNSAAKMVKVGDILIALYGANSGDVALARINGAINQAILCLRHETNNIFVYQYLSIKKEWIITTFLQGGQGNLSGDIIKGIKLFFPLPDEQQKIADCLSSLDELIAAEANKLDALKTHKKGLMQQLFPAEGETLPRLRFPEFREAGEWESKPLGKVCAVLQGYGFPEALQGRNHGKYPFCKVSDVSRAVAENGGLLTTAVNYVDEDDLSTLKAKCVPMGATVFAKIGEALRLNRRAFVQKECLIDNNVVGLKAIYGIADDHFVYILSQLIDLNKHCGGAVPSVNKSTLEAIEVIIPAPPEQKRIADCLAALDDLIAAQTQKIELLKRFKKGLMQQLFPVLDEAPA